MASREPSAPLPEPEPFLPDLSELESRYEILTELRQSAAGEMVTYLARHRTINREVTIDCVRAPWGRATNLMMQLQADARRESAMRHPNVVPVLEGRQIARDAFATVRPRVRGATLDDLLSSPELAQTISPDRLASIFEQLAAALDWAWANGIHHRQVTPPGLVFQQGSGRALFTFEPNFESIDQLTNLADDARTIGRLAWTMLAGYPYVSGDETPLSMVRPDVPRHITDAVDALANYPHDGEAPDIDGFIALLRSLPGTTTPVRARIVPPARELEPSSSRTEEYIVLPARPLLGRRLIATVAIAAAVVTAAVIILRGAGSGGGNAVAAATDSAGLASGVLGLKQPPDTAAKQPDTTRRAAPPDASQPAARAPRVVPAARPPNTSVTDVTKTGGSDDICSSADSADQHACLRSSLEQADNDVNDVYRLVIAALRREAKVSDDDPDPPTVARVRMSQRVWLELRDAKCHNEGSMPRYARARAACYNGQSARRLEELQSMLDTLPKRPPADSAGSAR